MSDQPGNPNTAPTTTQPSRIPQPPAARREPSERIHHGDTFIDDYAWLAAKENPATIDFLEAENAYTRALTAGQEGPPPGDFR